MYVPPSKLHLLTLRFPSILPLVHVCLCSSDRLIKLKIRRLIELLSRWNAKLSNQSSDILNAGANRSTAINFVFITYGVNESVTLNWFTSVYTRCRKTLFILTVSNFVHRQNVFGFCVYLSLSLYSLCDNFFFNYCSTLFRFDTFPLSTTPRVCSVCMVKFHWIFLLAFFPFMCYDASDIWMAYIWK